MVESVPITARVDKEKRAQVDSYRDRRGYDHRSEAVEELIDIGLREMRSPLLSRLREQAIDAAYHLVLVAVVVVISGGLTSVLAPLHSLQIAVVVLAVAIGPLAAIELARAINGQSDIGAGLRRWWT